MEAVCPVWLAGRPSRRQFHFSGIYFALMINWLVVTSFPGSMLCDSVLIFTYSLSIFLTRAVFDLLQKLNLSGKALREYFNASWVRKIIYVINLEIEP